MDGVQLTLKGAQITVEAGGLSGEYQADGKIMWFSSKIGEYFAHRDEALM